MAWLGEFVVRVVAYKMEGARKPPDAFTDFSVHIAPTDDGGTVVTIFGELDLATKDHVRKAVDSILDRPGHVVIDLRACPFIDSTGIAVLAKAALRLREQNRSLRLRGVRERVRRILDIAGLSASDLLVIEPEDRHPADEPGSGK